MVRRCTFGQRPSRLPRAYASAMNQQSLARSRLAAYFAALILVAIAAAPFGCSTSGTAPAAKAAATSPGKFVWHDLTTDDPAACKKFYAALLGWQYVDTTVL